MIPPSNPSHIESGISFEYNIKKDDDIRAPEQNLHTIPAAVPMCQEKGETLMLYYTIGIDEEIWRMLEKICEIKNLTPDQLIKQGIEKLVEKEYLDIM